MSETKTTKVNIKKSAKSGFASSGNKDMDALIAKAIRTVQANKRQAAAKSKTRSEVRGGGRKPWKQKGTGRARAGSNRSPIWRGGGITFGPTGNQNYSLSMNKKEMKAAKEEAIRLKKSDIVSISGASIKKTKDAAKVLKDNKITGKVLVLIDAKKEDYQVLKKAFRNIEGTNVKFYGNEDIHDILSVKKIVIIKKADPSTRKSSNDASSPSLKDTHPTQRSFGRAERARAILDKTKDEGKK